jgi:putative nucleotidyltransferase with HDIG domain
VSAISDNTVLIERRLPDRCGRRSGFYMSTSFAACASKPAEKMQMLFVDDEPAVLKVLSATMRPMVDEWDMHFVENGEDALALIERQPVDAVISDMRMPGMNGVQLLNHVLRLHPQAIRFILSGYSDFQDIINSAGVSHQFLHKPCNLVNLRDNLKRATRLKSRLRHGKLCKLAARLVNLPSMPDLYVEIMDALLSPTSTIQRIADIASKDPALTAKLLQLSNSAFFGVNRTVNSAGEAVQFLGVGVIQSLALAIPLFNAFDRRKCPAFPLDQIWNHSVQTGVIARRLAREQSESMPPSEQAFTAGLLHDIGKLILADSLPEEYGAILAEAREHSEPLMLAEKRCFEATHAEVGGYLLALWGLPFPMVDAVAHHHEPGRAQGTGFDLTGLIHVANTLQHERAKVSDLVSSPIDLDYIQKTGMAARLDNWRNSLQDEAAE